ncbi:MAG: SGNH/GDSL hydrolase family protein [Micrococcales bacterium]|nr:SGNH/GDSL hydrolase family protein [Micrococcales bacterium]
MTRPPRRGASARPHHTHRPIHPRRVLLVGALVLALIGLALWRAGDAEPPAAAYRGVVLGDSVPSGFGCACTPFADEAITQRAAQLHRPVALDNLAGDGYTTDDVLAQLADIDVQDALRQADAVVLTIGANDLDEGLVGNQECVVGDDKRCAADEVTQLRGNTGRILASITRLVPRGAHVVVTDYWSVFKDGAAADAESPGYASGAAAATRAVSDALRAEATRAGVDFVAVGPAFHGPGRDTTALLQAHGDHPNAAGHHALAALVLPALGD